MKNNPWTTACLPAFCADTPQGRAYAAAARIEFKLLTGPNEPDAVELRLATQETDRRLRDLTAMRERTRQRWTLEREAREVRAMLDAFWDRNLMIDSTI